MSKVLVISDLHIPFEHVDSFKFLKAVQEKYKTNITVAIGDLTDQHAMSRWDIDPDGESAGKELALAMKHLQPFYTAFPEMYICYGNHDLRAYKKAFKSGLPRVLLRGLKDVLQAPKKWIWVGEVIIDGIRYEHGDAAGERASGATAMRCLPLKNMQSTVFGHYHTHAGIEYGANPRMLFFGMNVGCLIDKNAYAFEYGKAWKAKPILGCGLVIDGMPIYVPMILNGRGRWVESLK